MNEIILDNYEKNSILKQIFLITAPASAEMILQNIMGLIDTAFVGRLGTDSMAGVSLINQLSTLLIIIFGTIGVGGSILIAQCYGKKDFKKITQSITSFIFIGAVISILLISGLLIFGNQILLFMGAESKVRASGITYLNIVAFSFVFIIISNFLNASIRAMGNTRTPLLCNFVGVVLNTVLNYIFLFVLDKGVAGVAYATLISRGVTFILILAYLLWRNKEIKFTRHNIIGFNKSIYSAIGKQTLPVLIGEAAWAIGNFSYTLLYTKLGTKALVASQVVFSVEEIFIMFSYGLTVAGLTMIGQEIGKGNISIMKYKAKLIMKCGRVNGLLFGSLLILFTLLFLNMIYPNVNADSIRWATIALCFNALYQFVKVGSFILGNGILKGGGDTKRIMVFDMICVSTGVTTAFILGVVLEYGFFGVLMGKTLDELLRYTLMYRRYKSNQWYRAVI